MKHTKKIYAIAILCATALIAPQASYAVWGMGDVSIPVPIIPTQVAQTIGQVTQIVDMVKNTLKTFGLDVAIYKGSQKLSQKLVAKVLNKANGGASGDSEPQFITNFGKYFENIAGQELNKFVGDLDKLDPEKSPFAKSISMGITNQTSNNSNELERFSLNKIPGLDGNNWKAASTDISVAGDRGWDFYSQLALPQNTPLGSAVIAQDKLASQIIAKQATAKTELTSSGFTPDKGKCSNSPDIFSNNSGFGSANPCASSDVKTPSAINQEQSKQPGLEAFARLRDADTFGKLLFGTIQQIVTGLAQKGFSSLRSDGGAAAKSYGDASDINRVTNSGRASWASSPQQVVDLRNELDGAISRTQSEITYLNQTVETIKKPITGEVGQDNPATPLIQEQRNVVVRLEWCQPGADTGYKTRLLDYITAQTKLTQTRAGLTGKKGENNSGALNIIRRLSDQAVQEENALLLNPFLTIPASVEIQSTLDEYYKTSKQFSQILNLLITKRQVLNQLKVIQAEVTALNTQGLMLFDDQWRLLSTTSKNQLYATVSDKILNPDADTSSEDLSGYIDPEAPGTLRPLPANNPATAADERDLEMQKRVFDEQWNEWELTTDEAKKEKIYAHFAALNQDIADAGTVRNELIKAVSIDEQVTLLRSVLDDCTMIRDNLVRLETASPTEIDAFIATLKTERIRNAFKGPSILTARTSGIDFAELNKRIVEESEELPGERWNDSSEANVLQADLPQTAQGILDQDRDQNLFCRLTHYHLTYWTPTPAPDDRLDGAPIGCASTTTGYDMYEGKIWRRGPSNERLPAAAGTQPKKVEANWYHITPTEILFNTTDQT